MKALWDGLVDKFGLWVVFALICLILTGVAASGNELFLTAFLLTSISGRASLILAGIFFWIGWYCAHLRGKYEAKGCRLSEEDRPSIKWTMGPVMAWFAFVYYALAEWEPSSRQPLESDGMLELVAQSICVPVMIGLLVHEIATTVKHSQAMNKIRRNERLENS